MPPRKLPSANQLRKGRLSKQDTAFIEEMSQTDLSDIEISKRLNRSLKQVSKYRLEWISKAPRVTVLRNEASQSKQELHSSPTWPSIKEQFSEKELMFYENSYIEYRRQLKDVSSTEKTQLHHLISIDIVMNRLQIDRKQALEEIERLEKFLQKEHQRDYSTLNNDEKQYMLHCETQLVAYKASSAQRTKEYNDLLSKHNDILKSLKSTRDQRIKSLDDRGKFISLLHELEINEHRKGIGEMTALTQMAMEKEKERLASPYKYPDGTIDQPLLNADTNLPDYD